MVVLEIVTATWIAVALLFVVRLTIMVGGLSPQKDSCIAIRAMREMSAHMMPGKCFASTALLMCWITGFVGCEPAASMGVTDTPLSGTESSAREWHIMPMWRHPTERRPCR